MPGNLGRLFGANRPLLRPLTSTRRLPEATKWRAAFPLRAKHLRAHPDAGSPIHHDRFSLGARKVRTDIDGVGFRSTGSTGQCPERFDSPDRMPGGQCGNGTRNGNGHPLMRLVAERMAYDLTFSRRIMTSGRGGVRVISDARSAPDMNPVAERFVGSLLCQRLTACCTGEGSRPNRWRIRSLLNRPGHQESGDLLDTQRRW